MSSLLKGTNMTKIFIEAQWYKNAQTWRSGLSARLPDIPNSDSTLSALAQEGADKGWYSHSAHPEDYEIDHGDDVPYITCGYYFGDETKTVQAQEYLQKRIAIEAEVPCVPGSARLIFCQDNEHPGDSYTGETETISLARDHI